MHSSPVGQPVGSVLKNWQVWMHLRSGDVDVPKFAHTAPDSQPVVVSLASQESPTAAVPCP